MTNKRLVLQLDLRIETQKAEGWKMSAK